jgi:hypothetical protein
MANKQLSSLGELFSEALVSARILSSLSPAGKTSAVDCLKPIVEAPYILGAPEAKPLLGMADFLFNAGELIPFSKRFK